MHTRVHMHPYNHAHSQVYRLLAGGLDTASHGIGAEDDEARHNSRGGVDILPQDAGRAHL